MDYYLKVNQIEICTTNLIILLPKFFGLQKFLKLPELKSSLVDYILNLHFDYIQLESLYLNHL